ncbi:MAG: hypothetical protein WCF84_20105 [Anaerolineae bacterium]
MELMRFEFATATRILFGAGVVREVPSAAAALGQRALSRSMKGNPITLTEEELMWVLEQGI